MNTRSFLVAASLLAAACLSPSVGHAQPARGRPAATRHRPPAKKPPVKYFDFTGDKVDASRIRPDGTTVFGMRGVRHPSLIRLRPDFLREIVRSGERL